LFSVVHLLQLLTEHLSASQRGGRVVFVSSGAATGNIASWAAYNASKAAMNSLCRFGLP
jgi:NAD(P)-dependent dehydrogenase (short-subunit alcohol dehydrogenase family)